MRLFLPGIDLVLTVRCCSALSLRFPSLSLRLCKWPMVLRSPLILVHGDRRWQRVLAHDGLKLVANNKALWTEFVVALAKRERNHVFLT